MGKKIFTRTVALIFADARGVGMHMLEYHSDLVLQLREHMSGDTIPKYDWAIYEAQENRMIGRYGDMRRNPLDSRRPA